MGIPLLRGREFTATDDHTRPLVAILSEGSARRLWPGADPIGKRLKLGSTRSDGPWITVVGLVRDVRSSGLEQPSPGQAYASFLQNPPRPIHLVVRSLARAEPLAEPVRRVVREVESDQPVYAVRTMEQILGGRLAQRRFAMVSVTVFSALAVLLAAVGLYAVVSMSVAQRTREIGVRMALGGTPAAITRLVLRDALRLAAAGTAIGMVGVLLSGRVLSGLLYGVTPTDPQTLLLTAVGIIVVGTIASLVPGTRAAAVDPIAALRNE
jgi:putative ABC transport system permease protein